MITSLSTNESNLSVVDSIGLVSTNDNTTAGLNWISEWVGYIALCMFSLVFVIPTLGIVGLIIWEYFSDEAERKAERKKEIDKAIIKMNQHFSSGNPLETKLKNRLGQTKTQSTDKMMEDILSMNDLIDNNTSTLDEMIDDDDEYEDEEGDSPDLNDVDDVLKQADSILHKRIRKGNSHTKSVESINFDEILT